jgi:hypothetical protein
LPLAVVVAGLPGLVGRLKAAGAIFGERSRAVRLSTFTPGELEEGLWDFAREGGAVWDADALELVRDRCGGYPYFLHLVGSHVWDAGTGDVLTPEDAERGIAAAEPYVRDFYAQRLADIGELQRRCLLAAARIPADDRSPAAVAHVLGYPRSSSIGSTLSELNTSHGLLRPTGDGRLEFSLPGLDEHLRGTGELG